MDATAAIDALQSGDEARRLSAAQALARDPQPIAAAALVRALADSGDEARQWITEALENLGPPPKAQLADLITLMQSTNDDVVYWAVTLVGRLGRDASAAKSALKGIAKSDRSAAIKHRARAALSWKRFTIRQIAGWTFLAAALVAYAINSDPWPAARDYCIAQGWQPDHLYLHATTKHYRPALNSARVVFTGVPRGVVRVQLRQWVFFVPWRVVDYSEERWK